jgi:hypothetical protein
MTANFMYKGEDRIMTLQYLKINLKKAVEKNKTENVTAAQQIRDGLPDNSEGTYLNLGAWGHAVMLLTMFANMFGGYIDENDVDREKYYRVEKNYHKVIETIWQDK